DRLQGSGAWASYGHMVTDITSFLQTNLQTGANTISISDFATPTGIVPPGLTPGFDNYGVGLTVIYSCPEYPQTKTSFYTGNDFFWCGSFNPKPYSSSYCFEFPATTSPRTINLDAIFGGQANAQPGPYRGGNYAYITGSGTPPAMDGGPAEPVGTIYNTAGAIYSVNPT
ncbi:hypothetical protein RZS08_46370, partial [Arthrospira platensis SPKY1]|nr:hypothetical protein [Arthrospira platensis SPKY1]